MNNIPAFPRPASDAHQHGMHNPQEGMTLLDYFAAKAMQARITGRFIEFNAYDIAKEAYIIANAMMKERDEKA